MKIQFLFCCAFIIFIFTNATAQYRDPTTGKVIPHYEGPAKLTFDNSKPLLPKNNTPTNTSASKKVYTTTEKHTTSAAKENIPEYYYEVPIIDMNGNPLKGIEGNQLYEKVAYFFPPGASYIGQKTGRGVPNGKGVMTLKDGTIEEGIWENGVFIERKDITEIHFGKFEINNADGKKDSYEGDLNENNQPHGTGIYTWRNGLQVYNGAWKNGKMDGIGRMQFASGEYKSGTWENNKFYYGTWHIESDEETGFFINDKLEGMAYVVFKDGRKLHATFVNDIPVNGIYTFPEGTKYEGLLNNEWNMEGLGIFTEKDSSFYIGNFKKGFTGYGKYFNAKGILVKEGIWQNDKFIRTQKENVPEIEALVTKKKNELNKPVVVQNKIDPVKITSGTSDKNKQRAAQENNKAVLPVIAPVYTVKALPKIDVTYKSSPELISTNASWENMYLCTGNFFLATKSDGSIWRLGKADKKFNQLLIGAIDQDSSIAKLSGSGEWKAISVGISYFDARFIVSIKNDGSLWQWVAGKPVQRGTGKTWISINANDKNAYMIKADGTLWQFTMSFKDRLVSDYYDGNEDETGEPKQFGLDNDWVKIYCGADFTFAQKKDGSIWGWGEDSYSQLANGITSNGSTHVEIENPVMISQNINWKNISCGLSHSIFIKADGTMWACGKNEDGELGVGDLDKHINLIQVGKDADWLQASAGVHYSLALKKDGTLWAWGSNSQGCLGIT